MSFFRTAINARRSSPALGKGDVSTVWIDERGGYGFIRTYDSERVLALINNSDSQLEAIIPLGDSVPEAEVEDLLGRLPAACIARGTLSATLPPLGAAWFRIS